MNRCVIAGANGAIVLSVPLEKGRNQQVLVKDVRICNSEKWQANHWKSFLSSYNSSPWFLHYRDELAALYLMPFTYLVEWNMVCLEWSMKKLGITTVPEFTQAFPSVSNFPDDDLDYRAAKHKEAVGPSGPPPVTYQQVFGKKTGFLAGMSVLDLLFCEGPKQSLMLLSRNNEPLSN